MTAQARPAGERRAYIECLRILAAFLVIVNHTNSPIFQLSQPSRTWFASLTYFFISKTAVPIFLMISGALLLDRQDPPRRTLARIARTAGMTVLFSVAYYLYQHRAAPGEMRAADFLLTILSGPITNAFWYLYLYLGLLCMLPLLQRMAAAFSRQTLRLLLVLCLGVAGVLPLLPLVLPIERVADFTAAFLSPYIGMAFTGLYIERHVTLDNRKCLAAGALFALLIAFQVVVTWLLYRAHAPNYLALDDRTLLPITAGAACLYVIVKHLFSSVRLPDRLRQAVCRIGPLTFGVYLLSDLARVLTRPVYEALCLRMNALIAVFLWQMLIFLAAAAVTALLRRLPGLRKWL